VETIDILESKVRIALARKAKLEAERRELLEELERLRGAIRLLESEKQEVKVRLDQIINKIELYLSRQGS
jgi:L-lactate utilization protein LutB